MASETFVWVCCVVVSVTDTPARPTTLARPVSKCQPGKSRTSPSALRQQEKGVHPQRVSHPLRRPCAEQPKTLCGHEAPLEGGPAVERPLGHGTQENVARNSLSEDALPDPKGTHHAICHAVGKEATPKKHLVPGQRPCWMIIRICTHYATVHANIFRVGPGAANQRLHEISWLYDMSPETDHLQN